MSGYRVEVTCPRCGGPLDHRHVMSKPYRAGPGRLVLSHLSHCPVPLNRHGTFQIRVSMARAGDARESEYKREGTQ